MSRPIPLNTQIHFEPWAWVELSVMTDDYIHQGLVADIYNNYGDYWFDGELRNNTGHERLYINSFDRSYAKRRARKYWSRYF